MFSSCTMMSLSQLFTSGNCRNLDSESFKVGRILKPQRYSVNAYKDLITSVLYLCWSCDQVTVGTGSRSRTGPAPGRFESSFSIRRPSARDRSSSRPSLSTAAPSPRSCCLKNTSSQVRGVKSTVKQHTLNHKLLLTYIYVFGWNDVQIRFPSVTEPAAKRLQVQEVTHKQLQDQCVSDWYCMWC